MSRAINLAATRAEILAMSGKHRAEISVLEDLASDGMRVVYRNGDDAAVIRRAFGKRVIEGSVVRVALRGR